LIILIIKKKNNKNLYCSLTNENFPTPDQLKKKIIQDIQNKSNTSQIIVENIKYQYIFKSYQDLLFVICQSIKLEFQKSKNLIKNKYLNYFIDIYNDLKKDKNLSEEDFWQSFDHKIKNSQLRFFVVSRNENLLKTFFNNIWGIQFSILDLSQSPTVNQQLKIKYQGKEYFENDSKYIYFIYHNYYRYPRMENLEKAWIKSMEFIIYLENFTEMSDISKNDVLNSLKSSNKLKKVMILINNDGKTSNPPNLKNFPYPTENLFLRNITNNQIIEMILKNFPEYL